MISSTLGLRNKSEIKATVITLRIIRGFKSTPQMVHKTLALSRLLPPWPLVFCIHFLFESCSEIPCYITIRFKIFITQKTQSKRLITTTKYTLRNKIQVDTKPSQNLFNSLETSKRLEQI